MHTTACLSPCARQSNSSPNPALSQVPSSMGKFCNVIFNITITSLIWQAAVLLSGILPFGLSIPQVCLDLIFLTVIYRCRIRRTLLCPIQYLCFACLLRIRVHGTDSRCCHAYHCHCHHPFHVFHSLCRGIQVLSFPLVVYCLL